MKTFHVPNMKVSHVRNMNAFVAAPVGLMNIQAAWRGERYCLGVVIRIHTQRLSVCYGLC